MLWWDQGYGAERRALLYGAMSALVDMPGVASPLEGDWWLLEGCASGLVMGRLSQDVQDVMGRDRFRKSQNYGSQGNSIFWHIQWIPWVLPNAVIWRDLVRIINTHIRTYVCMYICMCVCTYVRTYVHTYVHSYAGTYTYTYTHRRTYTHTYIHTFINT